jgi:prevent-host-death family protein
MAIHVNIGEAKTRLSELIAAALRGEEVVLNKAGRPVARLVPEESAIELEREAIAAKRRAAIGFAREKYAHLPAEAFDTPSALGDDYWNERIERKGYK